MRSLDPQGKGIRSFAVAASRKTRVLLGPWQASGFVGSVDKEIGLYRGYIEIMENTMEATIGFRVRGSYQVARLV